MREDLDGHHYKPSYAPAFMAKAAARQQAEKARIAAVAREMSRQERAAAEAMRKANAILNEKYAKTQQQLRDANEALTSANRALTKMRYGVDCPTIHQIADRICKWTGVPKIQILSQRKTDKIVLVRQAIYYWCCRRTPYSLPEIGRRLGGKDHTSVLHGVNKYPKKRAAQGRTLRPARG